MDQTYADSWQMKPESNNPTEVLLALDRELDHERVPPPWGTSECLANAQPKKSPSVTSLA